MRGQTFAWPTTVRSVRPASVGSRGCGKKVGGWFIGLVGRGVESVVLGLAKGSASFEARRSAN